MFAFGLIGKTDVSQMGNSNIAVVVPNANNQNSSGQIKSDMAKITGGKFRMGRNDGEPIEQPEHEVDVKDYWMDKTEVTETEYEAFVTETSYTPTPKHWERGKPPAGAEKSPVRNVNLDDIEAFIKWRSARDKKTYRLPTEAEWEYAARNGGANNLYPWGDTFQKSCAVVDEPDSEPEPVGSRKCGENKWGVLDLIGNVYEWTGTRAAPYPGNTKVEVREQFIANIIRGGSALSKSGGKKAVTSTHRLDTTLDKRDQQLGFRLVRSE